MLQTLKQSTSAFTASAFAPHSLEAQVGNTPLIRLRKIERDARLAQCVALYGKAEWFNPSGSVKDRAALNIIRAAEWAGQLCRGMTLLDSTSGNMGIAYAMLGAARGYKVRLTIPSNASPERLAILRAYGAELLLTDPLEGSDGALREAQRLAQEGGDSYYADQYNNAANWQAHYHTTANEIWRQTNGRISHFVAGLGTSGTFMGATRRLKELNSQITAVAMQPDSPFNGLEGLKHMPTAIQPAIYDPSLPDATRTVRTEEAYDMAQRLARLEGLFAGISAAAAVCAALDVARELRQGVVVTVLPDNGFKYLSERFWQE